MSTREHINQDVRRVLPLRDPAVRPRTGAPLRDSANSALRAGGRGPHSASPGEQLDVDALVGNRIRAVLAQLIIGSVYVPRRIAERVIRRRLPATDHYWIMRLFRALRERYPVMIRYANPVSEAPRQISMYLDLCENNQQWLFRMRGAYEREWLRVIADAMSEAGCFIDLGANVGAFTLPIAQAFPKAEVIAVEPLPANYEALVRNVHANHLGNVQAVQAVVANGAGRVTFYVNPIHDGGGSIVPSDAYRTGDIAIDAASYRKRHPSFVAEVDVRAVKLDELVQGRCVLKVDVEGAEEQVLRSGAKALAAGLVDVAVVEVREDTAAGTVALLDEVGFDSFAYGHRIPLNRVDAVHAQLGNLLCLRRGTAAHARLDFADR